MTRSIKRTVLLGTISLFSIIVGCFALYDGHIKNRQADAYQAESKQLGIKHKLTKFQKERPVYSVAETSIDDFMNGFLTFKNQKEFNHRRKLLKPLITNTVYDDNVLFKTDKYNKITQLALEGTYVRSAVIPNSLSNDKRLTADVYVTQTLNFAGKQGKNVVKVYTVSLDGNNGKLTGVKELGVLDVNVDSSAF